MKTHIEVELTSDQNQVTLYCNKTDLIDALTSAARNCESCHNHGWRIFQTEHGAQLQRCDTCERFQNDHDAMADARRVGVEAGGNTAT